MNHALSCSKPWTTPPATPPTHLKPTSNVLDSGRHGFRGREEGWFFRRIQDVILGLYYGPWAPTKLLIQDPCPVGLPIKLTVARATTEKEPAQGSLCAILEDSVSRGHAHGIPIYLLLYHPHPKQGPDRPSLSIIWACFRDGGGIETGNLKAYELWEPEPSNMEYIDSWGALRGASDALFGVAWAAFVRPRLLRFVALWWGPKLLRRGPGALGPLGT